MKSLFTKYSWLQLILSILLLFGGSLIIIFTALGRSDILQDGLNIIVAVILFLFGGFAIVASFVFESQKLFTNGLLYGSAYIALGVFLCVRELVLLEYLVYLLAIFFIVVGGIELLKAIIMLIRKDNRVPAIVATFIIAALFIAGGILALIFKENVKDAFCIIAGVLLFIAGVFNLVFGIKEMVAQSKAKGPKKPKKAQKQEQPVVIDQPKEIDFTAIEKKEE